MPKKLRKLGKIISAKAEIQNISREGIWVLVNDQEFFLSFAKFPWFLKATIDQIYDLQFFHGKHLYWPVLDIDIDLKSLEYPNAYPLSYK